MSTTPIWIVYELVSGNVVGIALSYVAAAQAVMNEEMTGGACIIEKWDVPADLTLKGK